MRTGSSGATYASAVRTLGVIVAGFAIATACAIAVRAPFEFDEAAYAVKARSLESGVPASAWYVHRAPGLPAMTAWMGDWARTPAPWRAVGVVWGAVAVAGVWVVGRSVGDGRVAAMAAVAVGFAPPFLERGAQFMTDVGAAGLLVFMWWVLWRGLSSGGAVAWAAPLAAGAFYLRYGSVVPIAAVLVSAAVIWRAWRRVGFVAAALGVLLLPHAVRSWQQYGAPWSVLVETRSFVNTSAPERGLWDYAVGIPFWLAGPVVGALMLVGLGEFVWRRAGASADRTRAFLVAPAVVTMVVLGVSSHAEPRFVFFSVALLAVAGARVVAGVPARLAVVAGVVVATAGTVVTVAETRSAVARRAENVRIARALDAVAGEGCVAEADQVAPVAWYSGCVVRAPREKATTADFVVTRYGLPLDRTRWPSATLVSDLGTAQIYRIGAP